MKRMSSALRLCILSSPAKCLAKACFAKAGHIPIGQPLPSYVLTQADIYNFQVQFVYSKATSLTIEDWAAATSASRTLLHSIDFVSGLSVVCRNPESKR